MFVFHTSYILAWVLLLEVLNKTNYNLLQRSTYLFNINELHHSVYRS